MCGLRQAVLLSVVLGLLASTPFLALAKTPSPRVIFVATVRLDEPNKQDNAVLDPMVILEGTTYLSPLEHREQVEPLLKPPARYDLTQAGVVKGTLTPVAVLSSEHCDNGLMTSSGADIQSGDVAMSEPDYHVASFLVDSSPLVVDIDGLPHPALPLTVSETDKQALLSMAKAAFKKEGLPDSAVARVTLKDVDKRQLDPAKPPVVLATFAIPLPEYGDGEEAAAQPADTRYASMFWAGQISAQGQPTTLWSALSHDAQSEESVAYYSFIDAQDLNQDGVQEVFLQRVSYYSDAGISFVILGWDGKQWAIRYEGGGNSGC